MVNASQVRAIGCYKESTDEIVVEYINGDETTFNCDNQITRDGILAEIEEVFCPKKLFNQIEEEL
jgi:hypothetical protein